ncbi:hypothetical protein SEA_MAGPIE_82 [Mycobacterium phage Magpie]|uniref:Uncharacterized protein n=1 Tax=Mycobacterium phage Magpie TaxID=2599869 RepID=A0A5J6TEZ7_9CAUD|nr:hypothetical protein SEA_MAGPIE_82 [Mycobacterium phage Magpie]
MSTIVIVTKGQVIDMLEDRGVKGADMLDGMIEAQADLGQVTWDHLAHHVALGRYADVEFPVDGLKGRVAVFNLDMADGMDVIRVTNYVNGHTDEVPQIKH